MRFSRLTLLALVASGTSSPLPEPNKVGDFFASLIGKTKPATGPSATFIYRWDTINWSTTIIPTEAAGFAGKTTINTRRPKATKTHAPAPASAPVAPTTTATSEVNVPMPTTLTTSFLESTSEAAATNTDSSSSSAAAEPSSHPPSAATPIQVWSPTRCTKWYTVTAGQDCGAVASENGITVDEFLKLNPVISPDCAPQPDFWAGYAYCVASE